LATALIGVGVFQVLHRFYLKKRCTEQVFGTVAGTRRKRGRRGSSTYYVKYTYSAEGIEYEKKPSVSRRQYLKMNEGDGITVYYDPAKPQRCHVLEIEFRIAMALCFIAGGGFCALLIFI